MGFSERERLSGAQSSSVLSQKCLDAAFAANAMAIVPVSIPFHRGRNASEMGLSALRESAEAHYSSGHSGTLGLKLLGELLNPFSSLEA